MTKEEAKKIIMEFAEVFNESYSHCIVDSDVDKFLELGDVVKKLTIPVVVGQSEQLVCDICKDTLKEIAETLK